MKTSIRKVNYRLKKMPVYLLIPAILVVKFLISVAFEHLWSPGDNPVVADFSLPKLIIMGSLVIPLLETAVFQLVPIELILRIKPKWKLVAMLLSAILFGLNHWFTAAYVVYTFIVGVLYAWIYILCREKKGTSYAFWIIAIIHALWNTLATIEDILF